MSKYYSTDRDERAFISGLDLSSLLEHAVQWISENLEPDQVFDEDELHDWAAQNERYEIGWIAENMDPEEVFAGVAGDALHDWAVENGYISIEGLDQWALENGYAKVD